MLICMHNYATEICEIYVIKYASKSVNAHNSLTLNCHVYDLMNQCEVNMTKIRLLLFNCVSQHMQKVGKEGRLVTHLVLTSYHHFEIRFYCVLLTDFWKRIPMTPLIDRSNYLLRC